MERPIRRAGSRLEGGMRGLIAAAAMAGLLLAPAPVRAQSPLGKMSVIRDAEIEKLLREYANPLLRAARVNGGATRIILIGNRSFNAFVAGGRNIFVHVGAIIESRTPNELIGVLAHEIAHIAGGHLARQRMALDQAAMLSVAGMLLSAGTLVASSQSRNVGSNPLGAAGVMTGPQELLRRAMLHYKRGEEQAADVAALKYLNRTGQSGRGLLTTLKRFNRDAMFRTRGIDPYLLSHPLPRERISFLENAAVKSRYFHKVDPPARRRRHEMARAKLIGFLGSTGEISRRYPVGDNSLAAQYAHAISAYRFGRLSDAVVRINRLIRARPRNAYFHELKGQALLEGGRARQAIGPLRRAVRLSGNATPITVMLGHALVSTNNPRDATAAIRILNRAAQREKRNAAIHQFLAMAWERKGNTAMAQLSAAQALFLAGKHLEARTQAARAKRKLKKGSPAWLKADDILTYRPPKN